MIATNQEEKLDACLSTCRSIRNIHAECQNYSDVVIKYVNCCYYVNVHCPK